MLADINFNKMLWTMDLKIPVSEMNLKPMSAQGVYAHTIPSLYRLVPHCDLPSPIIPDHKHTLKHINLCMHIHTHNIR